jgi:hypothetical protein
LYGAVFWLLTQTSPHTARRANGDCPDLVLEGFISISGESGAEGCAVMPAAAMARAEPGIAGAVIGRNFDSDVCRYLDTII